MKVTVTSDLHVDFWVKANSPEYKQERLMHDLIGKLLPDDPSDIILIAGDIGHYNYQNALFLKILTEYFSEVYWTYGNHDLYLTSSKMLKEYGNSTNRLIEMIQLSNDIDNVKYLDGECVETHGIKIGGVATWYDNTYAKNVWDMDDDTIFRHWYTGMNDSRYIIIDGKELDYVDYAKIANAKVNNVLDCDLIFSHIAPDYSNLLDKYKEPFSTFYQFDGSEYLSKLNDDATWLFGHTHDKYDYYKDNVRLIANPLGYPPPGYFTLGLDISEHKFQTIEINEKSKLNWENN